MAKISVIMPVYNCEKYLHESIGSVLKQTIDDWELICIDDGSSDGSLNILKEYQGKDKRIKVHVQENKGPGEARNYGLRKAVGEYVAFLDSDDFYLASDALESMYKTCKKFDVKVCGTNLRIMRNGTIGEDAFFENVKQAALRNEILNYLDFQFDYNYTCFIYDRHLIMEQKIVFPSYRRFEDPPFLVQVMYAAKEFCFSDKALYCYRAPNSVIRFKEDMIEGLVLGIIDNLRFAQEKGLSLLMDKTIKRLEDEYSEIILHNISENSVKILQLLCEANSIIRQGEDQNYVIEPLKRILFSVAECEQNRRKGFEKRLLQKKNIYIYGAGKQATDFMTYLKCKEMLEKVKGILVSDTEENPKYLEHIEVQAVDTYRYEEEDIVVIAVSGIYYDEIRCKLDELKVLDYERLDIGIFEE